MNFVSDRTLEDFDPTKGITFYQKCHILNGTKLPEPAEIRGDTTNISDLEAADVVITNIQQLQGNENRWLNSLPDDFFDLILFDEAHHNVAVTWENLRTKFPNARVVNYSATPLRADGRRMSGHIIYFFPVARAIREGYVKQLKAIVLNPQTLRYVREENGQETEVSLKEVIRLGEDDSDFRRSIVTSRETLETIVNVSIRELERIREYTNDNRHKIIASALNYEHCHQIVRAYTERGKRAAFVHSKEEGNANARVYQELKDNKLDVIVQVRKLGEGFDYKYLSVAAVFSIFANLSPFVQFVGRIMRVIEEGNPNSMLNQGTVIFHAGSNIQSRWTDFQEYSQADQEYFQNLLPLEGLDFSSSNEIEVRPTITNSTIRNVEIMAQSDVSIREIPLIEDDPEALNAIELLLNRGYSPEQINEFLLRPVATTRQSVRRAERTKIDAQIRTTVGNLLVKYNLRFEGKDLDRAHLGRSNFVIIKSELDKAVNRSVSMKENDRQNFSQEQYDRIEANYSEIVTNVERGLFRG